MLASKCPNCGQRETLVRETVDYGTPIELSRTACRACGWSDGWVLTYGRYGMPSMKCHPFEVC